VGATSLIFLAVAAVLIVQQSRIKLTKQGGRPAAILTRGIPTNQDFKLIASMSHRRPLQEITSITPVWSYPSSRLRIGGRMNGMMALRRTLSLQRHFKKELMRQHQLRTTASFQRKQLGNHENNVWRRSRDASTLSAPTLPCMTPRPETLLRKL